MKIALLSDIHSNLTAFKEVLKDAKSQGCGRIVCLGDIVGYGYDPNGCIDLCREEKIECFLGNHDAGLVGSLSLDWFNQFAARAVERQRGVVTEASKDWLRLRPYSLVDQEGYNTKEEDKFKFAFTHGTLYEPSRFDYIQYLGDAALEFTNLISQKIRVLFVGHTHYANAYLSDDEYRITETYLDLDDEVTIDLNKWRSAIINVGSVGYPRVQPYSIYGIYDTDTHLFMHRILPFDFEDYIVQMKEAGAEIPLWIQSQKTRAEERQKGFR